MKYLLAILTFVSTIQACYTLFCTLKVYHVHSKFKTGLCVKEPPLNFDEPFIENAEDALEAMMRNPQNWMPLGSTQNDPECASTKDMYHGTPQAYTTIGSPAFTGVQANLWITAATKTCKLSIYGTLSVRPAMNQWSKDAHIKNKEPFREATFDLWCDPQYMQSTDCGHPQLNNTT